MKKNAKRKPAKQAKFINRCFAGYMSIHDAVNLKVHESFNMGVSDDGKKSRKYTVYDLTVGTSNGVEFHFTIFSKQARLAWPRTVREIEKARK